jgi:hypothetical protein
LSSTKKINQLEYDLEALQKKYDIQLRNKISDAEQRYDDYLARSHMIINNSLKVINQAVDTYKLNAMTGYQQQNRIIFKSDTDDSDYESDDE